MQPSDREAFLLRIRNILDQIEQLAPVLDATELWDAVESSANAVLAHHLAAENSGLPLLLLRADGIPPGFHQCNHCHRVLRVCEQNFRRDSGKKSGFRCRCKTCMPKKKRKKRPEEQQEVLPEQQGEEKRQQLQKVKLEI